MGLEAMMEGCEISDHERMWGGIGNGSGSKIEIMVEPIVGILFRSCQSPIQYYKYNNLDE
jgi:hypothetical protein